MRIVYKVLYPLGYEEHEVEDNFPTGSPFVEAPPILFEKKEDETDEASGRRQQPQFFNFTENRWEEAVIQDYPKKSELLENLPIGLQADNVVLKEANEELTTKAESLAQANSETMLTSLQNTKDIATIKEQLDGGK